MKVEKHLKNKKQQKSGEPKSATLIRVSKFCELLHNLN